MPMNDEQIIWNLGLLFATLCGLMGLIYLVISKSSEDQSFAGGLILQGTAMVFVFAAAHWGKSPTLQLGGLIATLLLIVRELTRMQAEPEATEANQDQR